jgi:hypothetical protein
MRDTTVPKSFAAPRIFQRTLITLEGIENKDRVAVMGSARLAMQALRSYITNDGREVVEV